MIPSNVDRQYDDGLRHRKRNQTIGVSSGVLVALDEDRVVFGNEEAGYWAPVEILIERLFFAGKSIVLSENSIRPQ
jgi:hypothetical protein